MCQAVIAAVPEWLGANSTRAPIVRTSVFSHFSSQLTALGASAGPCVISRSTTPSGQASRPVSRKPAPNGQLSPLAKFERMVGGIRGAWAASPPLGGGELVAGASVAGLSTAVGSGVGAEVTAWVGSAFGSGSVEAGPAVGSVATARSGVPLPRTWVRPMIATPAMSTTFSSITALLHALLSARWRVAGTGRSGRRPLPPVTFVPSPRLGAVVVTTSSDSVRHGQVHIGPDRAPEPPDCHRERGIRQPE